jgi:BMFP domain-containing protein YqiC
VPDTTFLAVNAADLAADLAELRQRVAALEAALPRRRGAIETDPAVEEGGTLRRRVIVDRVEWEESRAARARVAWLERRVAHLEAALRSVPDEPPPPPVVTLADLDHRPAPPCAAAHPHLDGVRCTARADHAPLHHRDHHGRSWGGTG